MDYDDYAHWTDEELQEAIGSGADSAMASAVLADREYYADIEETEEYLSRPSHFI